MKILLTLLLAFTLSAQTQTTVNGRKAYSGAVNAQTATYQALVSDFNAPCQTIPVASGTFTITLVASGSQPPAGQCLDIINYGSGVATVARSGQNINGGTASLTIAAGSATAPTWAHVVSDGTNYDVTLSGVSAVGGYGPCASLPVSIPTAGLTYTCSDAPYVYVSTGSAWQATTFGFAVTPPVLANFTQVNVDKSTLTAVTNGGIQWASTNAGSSEDVQIIGVVKGSGHYYVDACWLSIDFGGNGGGGVGLSAGLLTSSAFSFLRAPAANNPGAGFQTGRYTYNSTTSTNSNGTTSGYHPAGPLLCARFEDDGATNRTLYIGSSPVGPWLQIDQQTRTTVFTPADAIFALADYAIAQNIWLIHWSVHN